MKDFAQGVGDLELRNQSSLILPFSFFPFPFQLEDTPTLSPLKNHHLF